MRSANSTSQLESKQPLNRGAETRRIDTGRGNKIDRQSKLKHSVHPSAAPNNDDASPLNKHNDRPTLHIDQITLTLTMVISPLAIALSLLLLPPGIELINDFGGDTIEEFLGIDAQKTPGQIQGFKDGP